MINEIIFNNKKYPLYESQGNAAKYIIPLAKEVCVGEGYDIGCGKAEWAFPGAIPIDLSFDNGYHALNLPKPNVDYIFSSHCLEHLESWTSALKYWIDMLKSTGVLFLYLPHYDQEYWRPWNNTKHKHVLSKECIRDCLMSMNVHKLYISDRDLNDSFAVMCEKI